MSQSPKSPSPAAQTPNPLQVYPSQHSDEETQKLPAVPQEGSGVEVGVGVGVGQVVRSLTTSFDEHVPPMVLDLHLTETCSVAMLPVVKPPTDTFVA